MQFLPVFSLEKLVHVHSLFFAERDICFYFLYAHHIHSQPAQPRGSASEKLNSLGTVAASDEEEALKVIAIDLCTYMENCNFSSGLFCSAVESKLES